jgi:hypothetical protein
MGCAYVRTDIRVRGERERERKEGGKEYNK